MVVVERDVAGIAAVNLAGRVGEAVPDRLAFAVFVPRAFDLIGRCRRAPEKVLRKILLPVQAGFGIWRSIGRLRRIRGECARARKLHEITARGMLGRRRSKFI